MLIPILFWLLSQIPEPPPQLDDLRLFPSQKMVGETLERYQGHRRWCLEQMGYAANEAERRRWAAYLVMHDEDAWAWKRLDVAHDYAHRGNLTILHCGQPLEAPQSAREHLRLLRDIIGPEAYYGGCLPPLPQWPRIEPRPARAEEVPLPAAGTGE